MADIKRVETLMKALEAKEDLLQLSNIFGYLVDERVSIDDTLSRSGLETKVTLRFKDFLLEYFSELLRGQYSRVFSNEEIDRLLFLLEDPVYQKLIKTKRSINFVLSCNAIDNLDLLTAEVDKIAGSVRAEMDFAENIKH